MTRITADSRGSEQIDLGLIREDPRPSASSAFHGCSAFPQNRYNRPGDATFPIA
jgi:hypothetical protein